MTIDTLRFGHEICSRLDELALLSEECGKLTRVFMSPEQKRAAALVGEWMAKAGLAVRIDAIGNVIGRYEAGLPGAPALVLGSHLDSVRDAGRYDGPLGVITAIACVDALNRQGRRFDFAIEIFGFSDEEGTRFGATMLGSRAVAGTFDPSVLSLEDHAGVSMADAIEAYGLDPAAIDTAARKPEEILAYVELHIEQGPILENRDLPAAAVSAISGATRLMITLKGQAGHAGTVPMTGRRDALAAAAECILAIEAVAKSHHETVATVGILDVISGAVNVIPGEVHFTVDMRAPSDVERHGLVEHVERIIAEICHRREVDHSALRTHELGATPCAGWLVDQIEAAIARQGLKPFRLPSGAGHDGMAIRQIADIGMIFIRCKAGISHHPDESITLSDAEIGAATLLSFVENFKPSGKGRRPG
jgi:allantoate deiminase